MKMEKKIIYIVTSGSYSDYSVDAIFSTREKAQSYVDTRKSGDEYYDENDIQEWTIDEMEGAKYRDSWQCGILIDTGEIIEEPKNSWREFTSSKRRGEIIQEATPIPAYRNQLLIRIRSYVSSEHAIKFAVEARQKYLRTHS